MRQPFCDTHILAFLKNWETAPLDQALSYYFKQHKSLGANDRRQIGEVVYTLVRWKTLFDALDPANSLSHRLHLYQKKPLEEWIRDPYIPEYAKYGLSPFLFQKFLSIFGPQETKKIAQVLNSQAPLSIRVNLLKTTREELLRMWESRFSVRPSSRVETCIHFSKREPLFSLPEFKQGFFEVQDEGSQRLAALVEAESGQRVLDFCSGSGGKTLAIAPRMQGKGELYLHDIRAQSLTEAAKRLRRAGIQNAQILPSEHPTLKKLPGKMDWVLADVPCTGTGTLRRNPDMKWKIDETMLQRLVQEQRKIFEQAFRYVKPGGKIVYATCSIFPEENGDQVAHFLRTLPLEQIGTPLQLLPESGGSDGFFGAVFRKSLKE